MRRHYIIILTILLMLFSSMTVVKDLSIDNDLCKIFKNSRQITEHNFTPADHKNIEIEKKPHLNSVSYFKLYDRPMAFDKIFVYGHFSVTPNRLGLICYNKVREDDQNVYYFSLHIIDNCSVVKDFKILTQDDNQSGILYQWESSFNKDYSILTMTLQQTSEWIAGSDLKPDTLFTEVYKINLKSANLDTLSVIKSFKILKNDN